MTYEEQDEIIANLSEYFTNITGHSVDIGSSPDGDIWISSRRTNGREYLESIDEAERRLEILYEDFMVDDGFSSDPLEGL